MATQQFNYDFLQVRNTGVGAEAKAKASNIGRENVSYDVVGLLNQAANTADTITKPIKEAKVRADTQKGWKDGAEFVAKTNELTGSVKAQTYKDKMAELATMDEGYAKGFQSQLGPGYIKALNEQEEERVNAELSGATPFYQAAQFEMQVNPDVKYTAEDIVSMYAKSADVLPAKVRDAIYFGAAGEANARIMSATSQTELNEYIAEWDKEKSEQFSGTFFRSSRANKFKSLVTASDRSISNSITQKNKQFVTEAKDRYNAQIDNDYQVPLTEVEGDIDIAYPDPVTNGAKKRQYNDKYIEAETRRQFMSKYSPDGKHPLVPKAAKEAWQDATTMTALKAFDGGDNETFINTILSNPKFSEDTGNSIYQSYVQSNTTEDMQKTMMRMTELAINPRGSTALRQTMTDEHFVEMTSVYAIAKSLYGGDMAKARAYYNQQSTNTTKQLFDRDLKDTVYEYSTKLGPLGNQYKNTMEIINNIDPSIAKQQEPLIRKYFQNQITKHSTMFGDDVSEDTSMAPSYIDEESLSQEVDRENVISIATKLNEGVTPTSIVNLPNGYVMAKDSLGGISNIINVASIVNSNNKNRLEYVSQEEQGLPVGEVVTSSTVDIITGYASSIGGLGSRFGEYLYDQTLDNLEEISGWFDTKDMVEPNNNTLDDAGKAELEAAKEKSKEIHQTINKVEKHKSITTPYTDAPLKQNDKRLINPKGEISRNVRNNNPGNIKFDGTQWDGLVGTDSGGKVAEGSFAVFDTPTMGARALARDLRSKINTGFNTIHKILHRYAPKGKENDTNAYIAAVSKSTGKDANAILTINDREILIKAITSHEGYPVSRKYFTDGIIKKGLEIERRDYLRTQKNKKDKQNKKKK